MPSGPAKMVEFPSRCTTTNRTMNSPVTATIAFLPIESESSRMSLSLFRGFIAAFWGRDAMPEFDKDRTNAEAMSMDTVCRISGKHLRRVPVQVPLEVPLEPAPIDDRRRDLARQDRPAVLDGQAGDPPPEPGVPAQEPRQVRQERAAVRGRLRQCGPRPEKVEQSGVVGIDLHADRVGDLRIRQRRSRSPLPSEDEKV